MKALVYDGPGRRSWADHAEPGLTAATDAIVRVDAVTICGTDLHILRGDVPEVERGRILGHEAVGTIVEAGWSTRPARRCYCGCSRPAGWTRAGSSPTGSGWTRWRRPMTSSPTRRTATL